MTETSETISFSFGKNWKSYLTTVSEREINVARADIEGWLGKDTVPGKTVLDIGSGSGIHSLCYHLLGARELTSFDYDIHSVEATKQLWEKSDKPSNWKVFHGSILDNNLPSTLGTFDIVYSWGVLHHTGSMWDAIGNACKYVKPGGLFWIALYVKGPRYQYDLELKQKYNRSGPIGKRLMEGKFIWYEMKRRFKAGKNPLAWNQKKERGMNVYHDIVDWLGGLPYEVASAQETIDFCKERGFSLIKIEEAGEGGNHIYLFQKNESDNGC